MNKLLKIDNIMYRVSDLERAEKFYTEVLGMRRVWKDKNAIGLMFEQSDSEIVIHTNPDIPKFDYSYLVEDVVTFCNGIKEKGYKILFGPIDVRPGKYAVIGDPDENTIPIIDLTKFGGKPKYD